MQAAPETAAVIVPITRPKAVKHRHGNAHAVLFGEAHAVGEETSVVHQVHVRKQHALGLAGGAGGVLNVRGLIGIWVGGDPVWLAEEVFPLRGIEIDNVLKSQRLPGAGFFEDRFVVRVPALSVEEKRAHAGFAQHEGQLVRAVGGVHVYQDNAGQRAAELKSSAIRRS